MTKRFNPKNEEIKHKYFEYLIEAKQLSESTINSISKALLRYEEFNKFEDIGKFNKQKAIDFKKHLKKLKNNKGNQLSASTILHTINPLKESFKWLAGQKGFKSKIKFSDVEYFNLSSNEIREAKATNSKPFPTLEIIRKVLDAMPDNTDIEKRDRALIAFTHLTALRDGATISLKLKHIDVDRRLVIQDPKEVATKFSKKIDTYFFPVGDAVEQLVIDWVKYLKEEKLFDGNKPLFPKTAVEVDKKTLSFKSAGLSTEHWKNASPLRDIFKKAFNNAGFDYYNPHSFRNTIVQLGEQLCKTPEEFKAWSQNLGHESPLTTFISYGYVDVYKQGDLIKGLGKKDDEEDRFCKMEKMLENINSKVS